jgi:LacI family transcriptional regulator
MPTIRDVARRAGVAPITVSRVISRRGYASAETRSKVESAVAELGYVPNQVASSLRSKRTSLLALVLTDITNPYFTQIARGVEDTASDSGYTVIYCNTDESLLEEQKYIQVLLQNRVAGVLLVPAAGETRSVELLKHNHTPVVVLDRRLPGAQVDVVLSDSVGGAFQLVRLLLDCGHRRIALLNGPPGVSTADDRLAGYHKALDAAGIPQEMRLVLAGAYTQESGYELSCQALDQRPQPTALFAANNFIAIGALRFVQDAGLSVPADIALVGFDDLPIALITFPFLTVASQPAYEMGKCATELLLSRLSGEDERPPQQIILPTELIVRQSSGQPITPS